jgi:hypothetical protein
MKGSINLQNELNEEKKASYKLISWCVMQFLWLLLTLRMEVCHLENIECHPLEYD